MKLHIRYFALLRDLTGRAEEDIETSCNDVDCLVKELSKEYGEKFYNIIKYGIGSIRISILVNGKIDNNLTDGAEVAFLPPPSGGELLIGKRLDLLNEIAQFRKEAPEEAGSLVIYLGFVKGIVEGHKVSSLSYEVYEDYTRKRLEEIRREIESKYRDLLKLKIVHVIGDIHPGDDVILIMALGRGRKDAIRAVEEALELVKHTTGIWKLERRDDGEFWVVAGNTRVKKNG
ncbi:molybdenum biosynthesis protein MoaD [Sulfolobales archaeon HS-7]|nr:molybdenum biosynthesis protein MoaD [Sulfolobales archaeon HS-7]